MQRKPLAQINITPLVDVLLILVAVLMLVLPMHVKKLPVELPQTSMAGAATPQKSLEVSLKADGTLWLKDGPIDKTVLLQRVTNQTSVDVYADKEVRYEQLTELVSAIQERSPRDIALLTR